MSIFPLCKMGGGLLSYEDMFYQRMSSGQFEGTYRGFPLQTMSWCKKLKNDKINIPRYVLSTIRGGDLRIPNTERELVLNFQSNPITVFATRWSQYCTGELKKFSKGPSTMGGKNVVQYLGIAADEPIRIARHEKKKNIMMPLVELGWDEDYCGLWCKYNDLLSPIYSTSMRGGCWFCNNQGIEQLRSLRKNYPDLWELLMKWDLDSPTTFKADGHTVHDFDKRFELEDKGVISKDDPFFWKYLESPPDRQLRIEGI